MISMLQDRKTALQSFFYSQGMDTYKMLNFPRDVKRSDVVGTFLGMFYKRASCRFYMVMVNLGCLEKKSIRKYQLSHVTVFR